MANGNNSTIFDRNPLIDGGDWRGTAQNCQQVIRLLSDINFVDFDEEQRVGLSHITNMLHDALGHEIEMRDREVAKRG